MLYNHGYYRLVNILDITRQIAMDDYDLDSVASVLSECMQYSGNEDLT